MNDLVDAYEEREERKDEQEWMIAKIADLENRSRCNILKKLRHF